MTSVYNNYHYKHNQLSDANPFKIFSSDYNAYSNKIQPSVNKTSYNNISNQPYSKTTKLDDNSFGQNLRKTPNQLNDPIKSTSYNIINGYPLNKTMNYAQANNNYSYNTNNQRRDHLFDLLNYTGSKLNPNNTNYYNPNITTNNTYGAYTYQKSNRAQNTYNQSTQNNPITNPITNPISNSITNPISNPISNSITNSITNPIINNNNYSSSFNQNPTSNLSNYPNSINNNISQVKIPTPLNNTTPLKNPTPLNIPQQKLIETLPKSTTLPQNIKNPTPKIPQSLNQEYEQSQSTQEKQSDINSPEYYSKGISISEYAYKEEPNSRFRDYMEDKGVCIDCYLNNPSTSIFCLFDGHGGKEVSSYLQSNFPLLLKEHLPSPNITQTLTSFFPLIDEKIKQSNFYQVGSTGCIIYITKENNKKVIYSANIGDTRSILINSLKEVTRLSFDDRASEPSEYNRITSQGGIVFAGRIYGQLMLSRAFGDWELKEFGVSNVPHVKRVEVGDEECYVVIASDGVWDVLEDDDVGRFCGYVNNAKDLCNEIIKNALGKGSMDNISCFVIKVN